MVRLNDPGAFFGGTSMTVKYWYNHFTFFILGFKVWKIIINPLELNASGAPFRLRRPRFFKTSLSGWNLSIGTIAAASPNSQARASATVDLLETGAPAIVTSIRLLWVFRLLMTQMSSIFFMFLWSPFDRVFLKIIMRPIGANLQGWLLFGKLMADTKKSQC